LYKRYLTSVEENGDFIIEAPMFSTSNFLQIALISIGHLQRNKLQIKLVQSTY